MTLHTHYTSLPNPLTPTEIIFLLTQGRAHKILAACCTVSNTAAGVAAFAFSIIDETNQNLLYLAATNGSPFPATTLGSAFLGLRLERFQDSLSNPRPYCHLPIPDIHYKPPLRVKFEIIGIGAGESIIDASLWEITTP